MCPKLSRNSNSIVTGCTCISRYRNIEDVPTVHQRGREGAQRLMPIALLQAFLNRCKRLGYCEKSLPSVNELFSSEDDSLFERIIANSTHVLQSYLQDRPDSNYCLRERSHNKTLITKTAHLSKRDFFLLE